jgi:hypothetical protein
MHHPTYEGGTAAIAPATTGTGPACGGYAQRDMGQLAKTDRPTISSMLAQTERLANHLHEVLNELEDKVRHFAAPYPSAGSACAEKQQLEASSPHASNIEGINATLSAAINRINMLKHAVDI